MAEPAWSTFILVALVVAVVFAIVAFGIQRRQ